MGLLRDLVRRVSLAYHRPRHWRFRPGTIDARIFRWVCVENEYELPDRFAPGSVVLDVGGHIGSFGLAALRRGAAAVHCCEPDPDNFSLLSHNLAPYADRVRLHHAAAWRSDRAGGHLRVRNDQDGRNTGACSVAGSGGEGGVPALPFDDLVREAAGVTGRVRLLKLDCEGAEWPILLTSRTLDRVDAICGEYHLPDDLTPFRVEGRPAPTPGLLADHLGEAGFAVRLSPLEGGPFPLGLFFARRHAARARRAG